MMQVPAQSVTLDLTGMLMDIVKDLILDKGGVYLSVAWKEWAVFAGLKSILFLMKAPWKNRAHFDWEEFWITMTYIAVSAGLLMNYTTICQIVWGAARELAAMPNLTAGDLLTQKINAIATGAQAPSSTFALLELTYYLYVHGEMAAVQAVLFGFYASTLGTIAYLVVFGPLLVPTFMLKNFSRLFWNWTDAMLGSHALFASIPIFTYVFGKFLVGVFDRLFSGDNSITQFGATFLIAVAASVGFVIAGIRLARTVGLIFSGAGGTGAALSGDMEQFVRATVQKAVRK